jgi:hypothetical protein
MARRAAVAARGGRAALRCAVALAALAALATPAGAFYLPGVAPQDYAKVRCRARATPRLSVPSARSGWPLLELTQTLASRRPAPASARASTRATRWASRSTSCRPLRRSCRTTTTACRSASRPRSSTALRTWARRAPPAAQRSGAAPHAPTSAGAPRRPHRKQRLHGTQSSKCPALSSDACLSYDSCRCAWTSTAAPAAWSAR